jgi:phage-related protein
LIGFVEYDKMISMARGVSWMRAALRDFGAFPEAVQRRAMTALRMAAVGETADLAKPMKGFGSGVFEIAVRHRGDAFRMIYAVQLGTDIWVLHAFQKKSKSGIKTPRREIDLIRDRIRRVKEQLP